MGARSREAVEWQYMDRGLLVVLLPKAVMRPSNHRARMTIAEREKQFLSRRCPSLALDLPLAMDLVRAILMPPTLETSGGRIQCHTCC